LLTFGGLAIRLAAPCLIPAGGLPTRRTLESRLWRFGCAPTPGGRIANPPGGTMPDPGGRVANPPQVNNLPHKKEFRSNRMAAWTLL